MKLKALQMPRGLSADAKQLWNHILTHHAFRNDDTEGHLYLRMLCEAQTTMDAAQKILDKEGMMKGNKNHPQCMVIRDARIAYLKALHKLQLGGHEEKNRVGRPPTGSKY